MKPQVLTGLALMVGVVAIVARLVNVKSTNVSIIETEDAAGKYRSQRDAALSVGNDPEKLKKSLKLLSQSGALASDRDVISACKKNISSFSYEQIAFLISSKGELSLFAMKYVAAQADTTLLREVHHHLEGSKELQKNLIAHAASDSVLFSPEKIGETLGILNGFSSAELERIGASIAGKISTINNDEEKIDLINRYMEAVRDPKILVRLSRAAVSVMDVPEAIDWLKQGDIGTMQYGDEMLLENIEKKNFNAGLGYVNWLIDQGQLPRAQRAIEAFTRNYAKSDPESALRWVLDFDESIRTDQMAVTAFTNLYRTDPVRAKQVILEVADPKMKVIFETSMRIADGN